MENGRKCETTQMKKGGCSHIYPQVGFEDTAPKKRGQVFLSTQEKAINSLYFTCTVMNSL